MPASRVAQHTTMCVDNGESHLEITHTSLKNELIVSTFSNLCPISIQSNCNSDIEKDNTKLVWQ